MLSRLLDTKLPPPKQVDVINLLRGQHDTEQAERNRARIEAAKQKLGSRYVLDRSNSPSRKAER